jgi:hypothetical protein
MQVKEISTGLKYIEVRNEIAKFLAQQLTALLDTKTLIKLAVNPELKQQDVLFGELNFEGITRNKPVSLLLNSLISKTDKVTADYDGVISGLMNSFYDLLMDTDLAIHIAVDISENQESAKLSFFFKKEKGDDQSFFELNYCDLDQLGFGLTKPIPQSSTDNELQSAQEIDDIFQLLKQDLNRKHAYLVELVREGVMPLTADIFTRDADSFPPRLLFSETVSYDNHFANLFNSNGIEEQFGYSVLNTAFQGTAISSVLEAITDILNENYLDLKVYVKTSEINGSPVQILSLCVEALNNQN